MDERRAQIAEDLHDLLGGECFFDPIRRAAYRCDSGLYEIEPLGAVCPRHEDELRALVRYAADQGLALHPRGAGVGPSGGALGPGIVVDLSTHFRSIDLRDGLVVAGAGATLAAIDRRLRPLGLRLPIDPPKSSVATIGGVIAEDAVGPRSLRAGSIADHLVSARALLASGESLTLTPVEPPPENAEPVTTAEDIARRLRVVASWHGEALARSARRQTALGPATVFGYRHDALANPARIDLLRLACGSRGTLFFLTEATLRTEPLPAAVSAALLPFARLVEAADAAASVLASRPALCTLIDGRVLSLAREVDPRLRDSIPLTAEGALLVGLEGDDPRTVADRARRLVDRLTHDGLLLGEPIELHDPLQANQLLQLRDAIEPPLMRNAGPERPIAPVGPFQIPLVSLPSLVIRLQNALRRWELSGLIEANAGLGRGGLLAFVNPANPADLNRLIHLAEEIATIVADLGGLIATPPGTPGPAWLRAVPADSLQLDREIKFALDPRGLLNPARVLATESPQPADLRPTPTPAQLDRLVLTDQTGTLHLRWIDGDRASHLAACNNCGTCRTSDPLQRICPVFRASRLEPDSPRGKLETLRQIASGTIDPRAWGDDELRLQSESCVHCKLCRLECPSGVDVSALMLEARAAYVANHGLTPEDWLLSRIDAWSAWASRLPDLFNALTGSRPLRWLLERAFGLSRHRHLPPAARRSFLHRIRRLAIARPQLLESGPRVAYFLDFCTNHFDVELAESVVAVLSHLGVNVYVPPGQQGAGMPALIAGDLDRAREQLEANLRILSSAVRDGYTIVCSEPSALLLFRLEATRLTDNLDAHLVAANILDVSQYIHGLISRGFAPPPHQPVHARVGYHQPCHQRALQIGTPSLDLLRTIPGLDVEFIDRGCSGMAGTYGLSARHYRDSLRAGRPLLTRLREPDLSLGTTDCTACRMQMEQGSAKRTIHPIKLLALAYGLNPALRRHLTDPKPRYRLSS
ncbi:MAG: hypothetical protein KatS3mg108_1432 [Isosphaeraceae bacterium]|nr:MAG: hypothetical protein KatS3mg108_1432 [Isosphaeraceae bacterium]